MSDLEQAIKKAEAVCGSWIDPDLRDRVAAALLRERANAIDSYTTHRFQFNLARELHRIADALEKRK